MTKRAGLSPLGELAGQERPAKVTARLWKAQREGAESQLHDLQEEIAEYERLHLGRSRELVLSAVEDLPKTLIRARIAAGLTQEGLAHRLGGRSRFRGARRRSIGARVLRGSGRWCRRWGCGW